MGGRTELHVSAQAERRGGRAITPLQRDLRVETLLHGHRELARAKGVHPGSARSRGANGRQGLFLTAHLAIAQPSSPQGNLPRRWFATVHARQEELSEDTFNETAPPMQSRLIWAVKDPLSTDLIRGRGPL